MRCPYGSGVWGTDYLTVSHGMRAGGGYEIVTEDGREPALIPRGGVCSGIVHGTEALILRVANHRNRSVITWGDLVDLKPGDELQMLPWRGLRGPITIRLLHQSFGQWADRTDYEWPAEFDHALVAYG